MTDPAPSTDPAPEPSEIDKLRAEFEQQFKTTRESYEAKNAELSAKVDELSKHNKELEAALIRTAAVPRADPPPPEKTPEQLYDEQVQAQAKRVIELMKGE